MNAVQVDTLIFKNNQLYLKDVFQDEYVLPNLTTLITLYKQTTNPEVKNRIYDMLNQDLGTLLIIEIMIDATHEVTLKRLETGDISKNMKHVMDYYVILKSHYALAKKQYLQDKALDIPPFESCHFAHFPYGQVILRAGYPNYTNLYTDTSIMEAILN